jgi:formate hydrogenlyase transcriptional activator
MLSVRTNEMDAILEDLASRESLSPANGPLDEIVGASPALKTVMQQVNRVAPTDSTVLILGETGTGKELIARALHARSRRSAGPFIKVNCAAIPASLIATELFGHEKGAFTGAIQRRLGRFEAAHRGTIFLDEVGELPLETQITLLRVLQEREFERVGSVHPVSVDVRIVAATNRDLKAALSAGTFRQDLFYRLNVFPIRLPALRERAEDIPLLAEYLMNRHAKKTGKQFRHIAEDTLQLLQAYTWPGNIRELQNVLERALILSEGDTLTVDATWFQHDASPVSVPIDRLSAALAATEKELIETALAETRGRVSGPLGAAAKLGIPRQTLDSKIANLQICKDHFRAPATT